MFLFLCYSQHVEWKERIEYDQAHTWIIDDVVQDSFQFCVDGKDKEGRLGN